MELSVKHLAPYLPYELKLQLVINDKVHSTGIMSKIIHNNFETHPTKICINYQDAEHIWMFRPMLRPMSSLNNENIVKLKLFVEADRQYLIDSPLNCGYEDIQYLLENHFDVFGLIPAGLAVEII